MNSDWFECKKILCIRPDNMGDLLMSSPAIRALKQSFNCHITVLTSSMAAGIALLIPEIDDVICFDLPWVKTNSSFDKTAFENVLSDISACQFDAAVIFTVYSQNPLPSAMIAFMAGIPKRLAYCRENPYALLTDWVPDKEPYTFIKHQVQRDLDLVRHVGASVQNTRLSLEVYENKWPGLLHKLEAAGLDLSRPWVILHAGVSEIKREFSERNWVTIGKEIIERLNHQVLYTGSSSESELVTSLTFKTGDGAFNLAGLLSLEEFILLVKKSPLMISVNTGSIHIAAATGTPVIVLYALTNPQHAPWKATGKVFAFTIPTHLQSSNEVIRYVNNRMHTDKVTDIELPEVMRATREILSGLINSDYVIPELVLVPADSEEVL